VCFVYNCLSVGMCVYICNRVCVHMFVFVNFCVSVCPVYVTVSLSRVYVTL